MFKYRRRSSTRSPRSWLFLVGILRRSIRGPGDLLQRVGGPSPRGEELVAEASFPVVLGGRAGCSWFTYFGPGKPALAKLLPKPPAFWMRRRRHVLLWSPILFVWGVLACGTDRGAWDYGGGRWPDRPKRSLMLSVPAHDRSWSGAAFCIVTGSAADSKPRPGLITALGDGRSSAFYMLDLDVHRQAVALFVRGPGRPSVRYYVPAAQASLVAGAVLNRVRRGCPGGRVVDRLALPCQLARASYGSISEVRRRSSRPSTPRSILESVNLKEKAAKTGSSGPRSRPKNMAGFS